MGVAIVAAGRVHQIAAEADQCPILPGEIELRALRKNFRNDLVAAQNLADLIGPRGRPLQHYRHHKGCKPYTGTGDNTLPHPLTLPHARTPGGVVAANASTNCQRIPVAGRGRPVSASPVQMLLARLSAGPARRSIESYSALKQ